ncbi:hypothetical protein OY671_011418, partial [Metschnikowia pulcherrima]
ISADDQRSSVDSRSLGDDLKFVSIVSSVESAEGHSTQIEVNPSKAVKCERCWHYRDDVGVNPEHPTSCGPRSMATKQSKSSSGGISLPWSGIALIVILSDQFTKTSISGFFQSGDSHRVSSFFNVVRVHNTGAAFSFSAHAGGWQRWF